MKAIVLGCSGAGKTWFSNRLSQLTGVPVHHLDMMFWNSDGSHVERSELQARQDKAMEGSDWILDGNYASTLDGRLEKCDMVFFLDFDTQVCMDGAMARRGTKRDDLPWQEPLEMDEDFRNHILNFNKDIRPGMLEKIKASGKETYIFRDREEMENHLWFTEPLPPGAERVLQDLSRLLQ